MKDKKMYKNYRLLVIIMFLVCSGGGWWYRYWLQGRYRAAASAMPATRSPNTRRQNSYHQRTPACQGQQASISYNTVRNTVLLHRMWKTPNQGASPSGAYAGNSSASSAHFQNTNIVLNDLNCPYYQLYGPPPSYETVIAQARVKNFETPTNILSPDRTIRNEGHSHYFSHNNYHLPLTNTEVQNEQVHPDNSNCSSVSLFTPTSENYNNCHYYRTHDDSYYNCGTSTNQELQQVLTLECPSQQTEICLHQTTSGHNAVAINTASLPINPSDNVILEKFENYSTTTNTNTINNGAQTSFNDYNIHTNQQDESLTNGIRRTSNNEEHHLLHIIESNKQKLDRSKSLD